MPSFNALSAMAAVAAGGVIGGYLGYRHSQRDPSIRDNGDTLGFSASAAIAGSASALALKTVGLSKLGMAAKNVGSGANKVSRALMYHPLRDFAEARGVKFGFKTIPKAMRTPLAALAFLAGSVGAIAYSTRNTPDTSAYGSRDQSGNTQYNVQSLKERMGMMGASGDLVFGLNNMRHG